MKSLKVDSRKSFLVSILLLVLLAAVSAFAVSVGQNVSSVQLLTLQNDEWVPKNIPGIGTKVVALFYNDPDVTDVSEPISQAVKKMNFPKDKYIGVGVGNTKDSWKPDYIIKKVAKSKQKKYPDSTILLDTDHILKKAWNLGQTNQKSVIVIVGKDRKVKHVLRVGSEAESEKNKEAVVNIIKAELGIK